jgi:hypothetical protein
MKILVFLLPILVFVFGLYVGRWTASTGGLGRKERSELQVYRDQQYEIAGLASSGMELGEGTAFKLHDILNNTRKAISK